MHSSAEVYRPGLWEVKKYIIYLFIYPVQRVCRTYAESTSPRETYYDVSEHVAHALYLVFVILESLVDRPHESAHQRVARPLYDAPWPSCASAASPRAAGDSTVVHLRLL